MSATPTARAAKRRFASRQSKLFEQGQKAAVNVRRMADIKGASMQVSSVPHKIKSQPRLFQAPADLGAVNSANATRLQTAWGFVKVVDPQPGS
jgi:hypothetical protein